MKHIGTVIKILILVGIIMLGVIIYITCSGSPLVQRIDNTLPDRIEAPYEVPTRTHLYYAEQATANDDKSVTMGGWYENMGNKWEFNEGEITLPAVLQPEIRRR